MGKSRTLQAACHLAGFLTTGWIIGILPLQYFRPEESRQIDPTHSFLFATIQALLLPVAVLFLLKLARTFPTDRPTVSSLESVVRFGLVLLAMLVFADIFFQSWAAGQLLDLTSDAEVKATVKYLAVLISEPIPSGQLP